MSWMGNGVWSEIRVRALVARVTDTPQTETGGWANSVAGEHVVSFGLPA